MPEIVLGAVVVAFVIVYLYRLSRVATTRAREDRECAEEKLRVQKERLEEQLRVQKEREQQEFEEERQSTTLEYKQLQEGFARLVWDCSVPWNELTRAAQALCGRDGLPPLKLTVRLEVSRILKAFSVANGSTPNGLGRIYQAIFAKLEPYERLTVRDCIQKIDGQEHSPPDLPITIKLLSAFDGIQKTHLANDATDSYYSLVIRAAACCPPSMAVSALRIQYLTLLQRYISAEDFRNGSQAPSGSSNANCPECASHFAVLGVQPSTSPVEIKAAYRDLAQINHPDRFGGSERLRRKAEEKMKEINQAYDHIMDHVGTDQ